MSDETRLDEAINLVLETVVKVMDEEMSSGDFCGCYECDPDDIYSDGITKLIAKVLRALHEHKKMCTPTNLEQS